MTGSVYRIKPLEWQLMRAAGDGLGEWWRANTVLGKIEVEQYGCSPGVSSAGVWYYWYHEFFHEKGIHGCASICASIAEGKAAAEAYYLSRLLPALEAQS